MQSYNTGCKDCVFAIYDGKTQVGCEFDRINKFKSVGLEVVESYDEDREFYVIKNHICNVGRLPAWAQNKTGDLKEIALKESSVKYQFILIDKGDVDVETLKEQVAKCLEQSVPPQAIHIIRYNSSKISLLDMGQVLLRTNIVWSIQDIVEEEQIVDYYIDRLLNKYYYLHYVQQDLCNDIDPNISTALNDKINIEIAKFGLLICENCVIVNANVFTALRAGIFDQTLIHLMEDKCPGLIVHQNLR